MERLPNNIANKVRITAAQSAPSNRGEDADAGAVAVNFLVLLLGGTTVLAALGVPYQAARVAAGCCEGVFLYCAMRWFVFPAITDDRDRVPVP